MKVILMGYPGSQSIRKASVYLTKKYLKGLSVKYINYRYNLGGWSECVIANLKLLEDKYVILGLDDYLLNKPIDMEMVRALLIEMDSTKVCAKLCNCTDAENESYPVTTQYSIWDREYLISLLARTNTPWDFELTGSRLFKEDGKQLLYRPALNYYTNSALSKRWNGVKLDGLNEQDKEKVMTLI